MKPLRILYCGNFRPRHSTETHLAATFESLGHTVVRAQEGPKEIDHWDADRMLNEAIANRPDIFMHTRTWGILGDASGLLRSFAAMNVPTVAYHLDLFAPIPRGEEIATHPWWRCKYVFTPDGGSDAFWAQHGINHVYMPPGVLHDECYIAPVDQSKAADVIFCGSYYYHAEWPYRPQLIDWLKSTYGDRFRLVPGINQDAVRNHALNVVYASAKVVVGDSLVPNFTHERYTSDRLFETTGRGGFLIYPRIKGITDGTLVTEGEHIATYNFGDFEGLKSKIDYYLANPFERERIRIAGHEHTKANHTYRNRLAAMLEHVASAEGWE